MPATAEGIPAIEQLIYEGVNINITLIFAIERYREVMEAYMKGLERRMAEGKPVDDIFSVASFFVSRVDTNVDKKLDALIAKAGSDEEKTKLKNLKGKAAIANAKIAYEAFQETFSGPRWEKLAAANANLQRPLWASTSTKNPDYRDVLYVEQLIGPDTVDTMPPATIIAFNDHGVVERTVDQNLAGSAPGDPRPRSRAASTWIRSRRSWKTKAWPASPSPTRRSTRPSPASATRCWQGQQMNEQTDLGEYEGALDQALGELGDAGQRIWNKDAAWWSSDSDDAGQDRRPARLAYHRGRDDRRRG